MTSQERQNDENSTKIHPRSFKNSGDLSHSPIDWAQMSMQQRPLEGDIILFSITIIRFQMVDFLYDPVGCKLSHKNIKHV